MNLERFAQRIEEQHERLAKLYSKTGNLHQILPNSDSVAEPAPHFLQEIGVASEELQVVLEELHQQNEELIAAQQAVEAERQRYHDLFEFAPASYLVTDTAGKILEANSAAATMLNVGKNFLVGKPLAVFIPVVERQHFWSALTGLHQQAVSGCSGSTGIVREEWAEFLQPRHSEPIPVVLSVALVCKAVLNGHICASQLQDSSLTARDRQAPSPLETSMGHANGTNPWPPSAETSSSPCTLRWLLRTITPTAHWEAKSGPGTGRLQANGPSLVSASLAERQRQIYHAGEVIPLNPQSVWFISQGLVKLSTFPSEGEEVLLGLAGPGTAFAPGLTLPTYQAVALVEVQLISISLSEIANSPSLAQSLLPQISQRLQQAESLLAIAGVRRVSDRLYQLLLLLKQEIGQPSSQGSWLSVRLTHQDLANACCATRATITRQLLNLQQQGKISWCPKRHLILNHDF